MRADVVIRADASPTIGGGHVMRCLVLADRLAERGIRCGFLVNAGAADTVARLAASGFPVERAPEDPVDYPPSAAVVFDLYTANREHNRRARSRTRRVVVIDDLADRPLDADLVVDFTFGRTPDAYKQHVRPGTDVLLGPGFALLRPDFAALRARSLARRMAAGGKARRLFVSFGLTDFGGLSLPALRAGVAAGFEIDVAVGSGAPGLGVLLSEAGRSSMVRVHVDAANVAELMTAADFAVGAGGSATWERCCLGLPALLAVVADNQQDLSEAVAAAGAVTLLPRGAETDALPAELLRLASDGFDLRAMSRAAAAICDGLGAEKVADRILELIGW